MTYPIFDASKPTWSGQSGVELAQDIRDNLRVMRDYIATLGAMPGWNELPPTGGTPGQPEVLVMAKGDERVKVIQTWGTSGGESGNVVKEAYYYSSNGGTDYVPMADEDGHYVLTLAYTAGGYDNGSTWGNTP